MTKSLGEESRWEIFKYLVRIGDVGTAFKILFAKRVYTKN